MNRDRRERLLKQFDDSAAELLFLGLTPDELAQRLRRARIAPVAGIQQEVRP